MIQDAERCCLLGPFSLQRSVSFLASGTRLCPFLVLLPSFCGDISSALNMAPTHPRCYLCTVTFPKAVSLLADDMGERLWLNHSDHFLFRSESLAPWSPHCPVSRFSNKYCHVCDLWAARGPGHSFLYLYPPRLRGPTPLHCTPCSESLLGDPGCLRAT